MGPAAGNESGTLDFVLLGLWAPPALRPLLWTALLLAYLATMLGNGALVGLIALDRRLHRPMYLLLSHLALLDAAYVSTTLPQALAHMASRRARLSLARCGAQLYVGISLGSCEALLLAAMALDRSLAVCRPLHYTTLVTPLRCAALAGAAWTLGFALSVPNAAAALRLFPFCGPRGIRHFFCDIAPLLSLVCADTRVFEANVLAATVLVIMVPFCLIATSYTRILATVLRMPSASGRLKALSTCASHLIVVILFYGTTGVIHLRPKASYSPESKQVVSLSYTLVTPMLNPLIYSLRNKEVKAALGRLCGQRRGTHFP
uniref:Olfactory receptor n=1 Tax=Spermophilus dauricus TaxID=99837 RepID=A0A8C9QD93_SPEDA